MTLHVGQRPPTPVGRSTPTGAAPVTPLAPAPSIRRVASRNIAIPQIHRRTDVPTTFKDEHGEIFECPFGPNVRAFELPVHRIVEPGYTAPDPVASRGKALVLLTLDTFDKMWLSRYNASLNGSNGRAGGKLGAGKVAGAGLQPPTSPSLGATATPAALVPTQMERIMTAWEIAAAENPRVPIERLRAEHLADPELRTRAHVEAVRQHWLSKREANGGVPLLPELVPNPKFDDQHLFCSEVTLVDFRLPFAHREYTDHLLRRKALEARPTLLGAGGPTAEDVRETRAVIAAFLSSARSVIGSALERELLSLKHTQMTIYELACLRDAVDGAAEQPAFDAPPPAAPVDQSFGSGGGSGATGLPLSLPFEGCEAGFEVLELLHPPAVSGASVKKE